MVQTPVPAIHEILQVLHDGGRIDRFNTGNIFLTNIFGELLPCTTTCFELLLKEKLIQTVHLHIPGGECYKISTYGLAYIRQHQLEGICTETEIARPV